MNAHVKKLVAVVIALVLLCSAASCGKETRDPEPTDAPSAEATTEETVPAETTEDIFEETTEAVAEETAAEETTAQAETATEEEPATEEETEAESTAPKTKAEVIAYLNDALNAVKANRPGFTKAYKRDAAGDISGLPGWLSSIIRQNETKTYQKGTDYTDIFPAAGYSWSSRLRESDVTKFSIEENGKFYDIRVDLGTETNPTPGETSSYGRCMSVVTVSSAESIPGIKNVSMNYHDGYVTARVDSETNRIVRCTFSAAADVQATVSILGDVSVSNIVSTETFTDFVW
ncbi:MAG: hypothetical protein IKW76_14025 [Clostridia bacterium]|nr:hypothetical protein [Clostridia bacterium]